jgi:hypothetical protein
MHTPPIPILELAPKNWIEREDERDSDVKKLFDFFKKVIVSIHYICKFFNKFR